MRPSRVTAVTRTGAGRRIRFSFGEWGALPGGLAMKKILWTALACAAGAGCGSRVERSNPYDVDGTGPKKDGYIEGYVFVQGSDQQGGHAIAITDENGSRSDAGLVTQEDGYF